MLNGRSAHPYQYVLLKMLPNSQCHKLLVFVTRPKFCASHWQGVTAWNISSASWGGQYWVIIEPIVTTGNYGPSNNG